MEDPMNKKLLKIIITAVVILAGIYGAITGQIPLAPESDSPEVFASSPILTPETPRETLAPAQTPDTAETAAESLLDIQGFYDSAEDVALFLHLYGRLPDNYMTKAEARALGWEGGSLERYAPGCCIGGDTFRNSEGLLPNAPGRRWTECDIDTLGKSSRGAKRIVFSNDGLIYYTNDHYETFELLYGEP